MEKIEIKRITTDNPADSEIPNYLSLMNYCTAQNGRAVLRYADGKENVDLAEYVEKYCHNHDCTHMDASDLETFEECLTDCDCVAAMLYFCGVQAAENNARLKRYEDTDLSPEEIKEMADMCDKFKTNSEPQNRDKVFCKDCDYLNLDGDKPFCCHRHMSTNGLDDWCYHGKKRGDENA